jgi:hypothetical protein
MYFDHVRANKMRQLRRKATAVKAERDEVLRRRRVSKDKTFEPDALPDDPLEADLRRALQESQTRADDAEAVLRRAIFDIATVSGSLPKSDLADLAAVSAAIADAVAILKPDEATDNDAADTGKPSG